MKYKILALSVASVIGISSTVLASDNTDLDHCLYGGKEFVITESTGKTSIIDISFTKGDMLAINLNAGKKESDYEEQRAIARIHERICGDNSRYPYYIIHKD